MRTRFKAGRAPVAAADNSVVGTRPAPASNVPRWTGVRSVSTSTRAREITPAKLAGYLTTATEGDPRAQVELFDEMEDRDLHLVSVLGVRKRSVAGLPWHITPASDRARDQRIAAAAADMVRGIRGFRRSLVKLLDAITKGYGACEIDWRQAPGRIWVHELVHRPARWFTPDREQPALWRILSDLNPVNGEPLAPGAWVWHTCSAKSGDTDAAGALGRPLAWAYLFKNYTLKDWVIFAELYGSPIRLGKYEAGTGEEDRAALLTALQRLGVDAAAIFPEGTNIELKDVQRGTSVDVYRSLVEWCDKAYSKAVLGQTLTTEEGKSGSLALGQVHGQVRQDLVESDAEELGETLSECLLRPWVDYQYGPQERYPRLEFDADPPEDLKSKAELYTSLFEMGVALSVEHVHDVFSVPMPKEGEPVYQRTTPAAGALPIDPKSRAATKKPPVPATDLAACVVCGGAIVAGADLPPMSAEIERAIRDALDRGGYAGWQDTLRHLREHVSQARTPGEVSARLVQALERFGLQDRAEDLADEIIRVDLIGEAQVRAGEVPLGDWPAVPPRQAIEFWRTKTAMTPEAFDALTETARGRAFSVAGLSTLSAVQEIHDAALAALELGETMAQFEDRYEAALGQAGMTGEKPWHVANVYRTNLLTAHNVGRWTQQSSPESMARRPYLVYDSVDDSRARESHRAMDGWVAAVDDPIWDVWYPPNGYQCRCGCRSASAADVAARGLQIRTGTPRLTQLRPDGTRVTEPNVPDEGFRANPAKLPHEFDFSRFPTDYRQALGVP